MSNTEEVFVEKREGERVRIAFNEYEGKRYIDIRQFYQDDEGDWRPTKKGVTLPLDKLEDLKEAVGQLSPE